MVTVLLFLYIKTDKCYIFKYLQDYKLRIDILVLTRDNFWPKKKSINECLDVGLYLKKLYEDVTRNLRLRTMPIKTNKNYIF